VSVTHYFNSFISLKSILSMSCSVTTWESWTGAALRTGTRVSSEQTDEEDQEAGEW